MADPGTQLVVSAVDDGLVLHGVIDAASAGEFERVLASCVGGRRFVRLDMRRVIAVDATALRVLVAASGRSRTRGGDVVLDSPNHAVVDLVERSGLTSVLTILHPGERVLASA